MQPFDALLAVALVAGLAWLGFRIEPHWVSRDGRRMICAAQALDARGATLSRWHEVRVELTDDEVLVEPRRRRRAGTRGWEVVREAPAGRRGRTAFLLRRDAGAELLLLRLPERSRAVEHLRHRLRI